MYIAFFILSSDTNIFLENFLIGSTMCVLIDASYFYLLQLIRRVCMKRVEAVTQNYTYTYFDLRSAFARYR